MTLKSFFLLLIVLSGILFLIFPDFTPTNETSHNTTKNQNTVSFSSKKPQINSTKTTKKSRRITPDHSARINRLHQDLSFADNQSDYRKILIEIAQLYGEHEPDAGKGWLLSLENSPKHSVAYYAFALALSKLDASDALSFYSSIKQDSFEREFLRGVTGAVSRQQPEIIIDFLTSRRGQIADASSLFTKIGKSSALNGIEHALNIGLAKNLKPNEQQEILKGITARIISNEFWTQEMDQFLNNERLKGQENNISELISGTAKMVSNDNLNQLQQLIEKLSNNHKPETLNSGISELSRRLAHTKPQMTSQWINQISDLDMRKQTTAYTLGVIQVFDEKLAQEIGDKIMLE